MVERGRPESGFLLIGVIMFVLALTILGMSLYSLSSYEADFQARSHDSNAAFYRAQGGLTMVTQLLQASWKLDTAQVAVGHQGVDSVYVSQPKPGGGWLTTGPMNDSMVTVVVLAHSGRSSRKLLATYWPGHNESYYTRLFTVAGSIGVFGYHSIAVSSSDSIWTNDPNQAAADLWAIQLLWPLPHYMHDFGNVPRPDIAGYISQHDTTASPPIYFENTATHNGSMTFNKGTGASIDYYYEKRATPIPNHYDGNFSFSENAWPYSGSLTLNVSGQAVWVLPKGLHSFGVVSINNIGPGEATLVIIASNQPLPAQPDTSICFGGGLSMAGDVNLILVASGTIYLEQANNPGTPYAANQLSVYCSDLGLRGSTNGTPSTLSYGAGMTLLISSLELAGALPRGTGGVPTGFAFVRGSWRDLTP